eukprot:COSAG02_NODE_28300_length_592_cov_0.803245_1_plen_149_part_10
MAAVPAAADVVPLELEGEDRFAAEESAGNTEGQQDENEGDGGEGEGGQEATTKRQKLAKMFSRKKRDADGVSFDPALEEEEGAGGGERAAPPKLTSLDSVLDRLLHEPGSMKPGAFASGRTNLVKQRQNQTRRPKLRAVFARELPFYQT